MDAEAAKPSATMMAGPSSLWRLAERRTRKGGSANIFGGVNLWQLQKLFRAAGDQDAEQRAQLVWGQGDEAELAQALIGLRARGRRRGQRTTERHNMLGSHWLKAFNHLRIGEASPNSHGIDSEEDNNSDTTTDCSLNSDDGATVAHTESQGPKGTSERASRAGPGLRRGPENDPQRYLHRILR